MKLLVTLAAAVAAQRGGRQGGRGNKDRESAGNDATAQPDYFDTGFGGLNTDYGFDSYGESSYGDLYNFGDSYGSLFGDSYNYDSDADAGAVDYSAGGFGDIATDAPATFAPATAAPVVEEVAAPAAPVRPEAPAAPEANEFENLASLLEAQAPSSSGRPSQPANPDAGKFLGSADTFCNLGSGEGATTAATAAALMLNLSGPGNTISECPTGEVCGITMRYYKGEVQFMQIECRQTEQCDDDRNQNFNPTQINQVAQCRPEEKLSGPHRGHGPSVCRSCVSACATSGAADCFDPSQGLVTAGTPDTWTRTTWGNVLTSDTNA